MIGIDNKSRRVLSKEAYQKGTILSSKQDSNREFISLLTTIYTNGTSIPPVLLYQGKSHDLQDTWVKDIGEDIIYFTITKKGWTSNDINL